MRKIFIVLTFILLVLLIGCSSTVIEPKSPEDTLLVGVMTLEAKGWGSFYGASVEGVTKKNIKIIFTNSTTGKEYPTFTRDEGVFYILNPESGKYIIKKLSFTQSASDGSHELYWNVNYKLTDIEVVSGKVVNLGVLNWVADKTTTDYRIERLGSHETLFTVFKEKFPESSWLQREWVNINL